MGSVGEAKLMKDEASPDPLVGQLIKGRYHVLGKLATGHTGPVYLAQQVSTGVRVALKVLQGEYVRGEGFVKRFRQLMLAVAALSEHHENIVRVFDCEQAEDGRLFIAMEHLEGRPLSEVIRQEGALEIERALLFAEQMAEGLSAAHAAGIVHTDVRPENFMIVGKMEAVKLIGFEKARSDDVGAMDSLIRSGVIPRIPEYLAPEQIEGKEITRQTDIYALGVVLYQMLTGVVPFRAPTPKAVLAMHLQEAPAPLRDLRPEIPEVLEIKVLQALEKEPERRESYANDVVNESLSELVMEDLQTEPVQEEEGLIARTRVALHAAFGVARSIATKSGKAEAGSNLPAILRIQPRLQADIGPAGSIATKSGKAGARWKLAAIIGLLILFAVPALWMAFSRRTLEVPSEPSSQQNVDAARGAAAAIAPRQNPDEAQRPGPAIVSQPERKAEGTPALASQGRTSPVTAPPKSASQETGKRVGKSDTPAAKQRKTKSARRAQIPAAPRSQAPDTKTESQGATPDPTDVIDWVLKNR